MERVIIAKYSEVILKGKNRRYFEDRLIFNITDALRKYKIKYKRIIKTHNRIIIYSRKKDNSIHLSLS